MWENESKKTVIRNIILSVLVIGTLAALFYVMQKVQEKNRQFDEVLVETSNQKQEEMASARQESLAALQAEYDQDLAALEKYLPGIVCWGDNLTAGSFGNVSYPDILQKYIDVYMTDIYDFSSTIQNAGSYTKVDWESYKIDIPVVNMGSGAENTRTILGRAGAVAYKTDMEFTIPAETEPVRIYFAHSDQYSVLPLTSGDVGVNPVVIAGVEGRVDIHSDSTLGTYYTFTRTQSGQEVTVPRDTEILTSGAGMYKDYIHVVWIGTYGGYLTADDLVKQVQTLLERQTGNDERFIVIGPCSYTGSWENGLVYLDNIDSAMLHAFGSKYINLRKYLCSDGMTDAGITPTAADTQDMRITAVPESFRSATGSVELSAKAYALVGKLVYQRMDRLGFFDEVMEELHLDEITRELLKSNANYFTKQLG